MSASKKRPPPLPEVLVRRYQHLFAKAGDEVKTNFGFPFTSMNGNMYSFFSPQGTFALRLSKEDRAAFLEETGSELYRHETAGMVMPEYVRVPPEVFDDARAMKRYVAKSIAYAKTLKPKPAKKKK